MSGPSGGDVTSNWLKTITLTGLVQGVYNYQLVITDNNGATSTANVSVTVNPAQSSWNASAGPNQTLTLPTNSTTLTGSVSDPNTYISSYAWKKMSGPSGGDVTSNWLKTITLTGLVQGVYNYQLVITDNNGATSTANVSVTVNPAQSSWNASAGPNQTLTLPTNSTTLTGSVSDPNTYISSYAWKKMSGPSGGDVTSNWLKTITLTGLVQGVYNYQLVITDNNGATSTANVSVTVNAAQSSWNASAGPNQTLTLPTNSTTLTGSSSDPNTYISSYAWKKMSGPSGGDVTSNWLKTITLTGLVQGVYNYQLVMTDNNGATSTANVSVTVNAAQSSWTASAGPNQTLTLPTNSTTLTGSSSDPNTYISSYAWKKMSGPSGGDVTSNWLKTITLTGLVQGVYNYQLVITDNNGATSTANVSVTVNSGTLFRTSTGLATNEVKTDSTVSVNQISNQSLSLNENSTSKLLKIYPNPVADVTTLEVNIPVGASEVLINITDMKGSIVYKKRISSQNGLVRQQINMSTFLPGTYIVTVIFNSSEKQSLKVVKL